MAEIWHHGKRNRLKNPIWVYPFEDYVKIYRIWRVYFFDCKLCKRQQTEYKRIVWQGVTWDNKLGPTHLVKVVEEKAYIAWVNSHQICTNAKSFEIYASQYTKNSSLPADAFMFKQKPEKLEHRAEKSGKIQVLSSYQSKSK